MSIKKLSLLAGMAVALVTMALPAFASAELAWERNHVPLDQTETLSATNNGTVSFASEFGGINCGIEGKVHVPVHFTPGSTATIEDFIVTTPTECEGIGFFEGCELKEADLTDPVTIHATGTDTIAVTEGELYNTFHEGCFVEDLEITWDNDDLHITVDDPTDIHEMTLTGKARGHIGGLETELEVHGEFTLETTSESETVGITHVNTG